MRAPAGGENMSIMQMYAKYLNMAKTSTGKVQKFELREVARDMQVDE